MSSAKLPNIKLVVALGFVTLAMVWVSYTFIDKALVFWAAEQNLRRFYWLHHIQTLPEYFIVTQPILVLLALVITLRARFLKQAVSGWTHRFCLFIWASTASILLSVTAKPPLKYLFARTWPDTFKEDNPSLLQNGVYGFNWFESGVAFQAFPSGHTMAITAMAMVIWYIYPKLRWLSVLSIVMVMIGLLGMYYHFLSDIMAGFYIGWVCAVLGVSFVMACSQSSQSY